MTELWRGYSFMFIDAFDFAAGQSLSEPGSCWRDFYVNNMMMCTDDSCTNSNSRYSFWLATAVPDGKTPTEYYPESTSALDDRETVLNYISRCTVCISDYKIMALHSFSKDKPEAKLQAASRYGWAKLYEGYSFAYQVGSGVGWGTQLSRHSSCLQHFSPIMAAQTNGAEVRWISPNFHATWVLDYSYLSEDDRWESTEYDVTNTADRQTFIQNRLGKCYVIKRNANDRFRYYSDN